MAKCRHCERTGLLLRTDALGVCRPCRQLIQEDVDARLERVKEALVYVRCAKDPEIERSSCETAIETTEGMLHYEDRRLVEIRPRPSSLLDMLQVKLEEALRKDSRKVPQVRPLADGGARLRVIGSLKNPATEPPNAAPMPEGGKPLLPAVDDGTWWAWEPETQQEFAAALGDVVGESRTERGAERGVVNCYALIEPYGIRATLENLSSGGLFLRTRSHLPAGSPVSLILSTLEGPIRAEGVVRWASGKPTSNTSSTPPGLGIEFTMVSRELLDYLEQRLGPLEPAASPVSACAML